MSWYDNFFVAAANIVAGKRMYFDEDKQAWAHPTPPRAWFAREYERHQLHPAVKFLLDHDIRPILPNNWQQLLLEWPHVSETDANRLAYTPDEAKGIADRQVVTTIGKYLTRHFAGILSDHEIRDVVARFTHLGTCKHTTDLNHMIKVLINGPTSCMSKDFHMDCKDGETRHPYHVYDPALGWGMAYREHEGNILGRALTWTDPDNVDNRMFVRSYKKCPNGGYSYADEALEVWLKSAGFVKDCGWNRGTRLALYELRHGDYLAPYVDGDLRNAEIESGYFVLDESGDYELDQTSGYATESGREQCDRCGARCHEDEMYWVGYHDDTHVCESCLSNEYIQVYGRRGNEYYVQNDDAIEVRGDWYDVNYLGSNDIVQLANGEYEHIDYAVHIDSCDEWYAHDDDDICYAEDTEQYELKDNCWQCDASYNWYTDDVDYIEIDGNKYHPDDAPEQTETGE